MTREKEADGKIRVLVADDTETGRSLLRAALEADGGFEIVAEARNGREAVEIARSCRPDLVTMDLIMPVMGGLEAIEEIMRTRAVPILVVSRAADARNAFAAIDRGAIDVVAKPRAGTSNLDEIVAKAKLVAKVPVITRPRCDPPSPASSSPRAPPDAGAFRVYAIAASTGGPQALAHILAKLPRTFPAAILIAQHVADGFASGMAGWLANCSALPVRLAVEGTPVEPGRVYLSPSEKHLAVGPKGLLTLLPFRPGDIYHPSCDLLLSSVAERYGRRGVGVILTGMGRDGAQGMARILQGGGETIAQDEASSTIFGMNRIAIENGAARRVLPLESIPAAMIELSPAPRLGGEQSA